ncbi:MAG: hypothetical protein A2W31_10895 [Planctomycetes bacterium RBG_16_64_10]|nr:MAG: hypothetical protein A2W31_10895 [Planctomycetes bacterium RBG_16_64_10]
MRQGLELALLAAAAMTPALGTCEARAAERTPPAVAARQLLERLLPAWADRFEFAVIEADAGRDVFEIEAQPNRVVIRGNSAVAMAAGLHWYRS